MMPFRFAVQYWESNQVIDENATIEQLVQQARDEFQQQFGVAPQWITAAPGRVNLIGEHIDYNDGFVLPMAIERYVIMAAGPAVSPTIWVMPYLLQIILSPRCTGDR